MPSTGITINETIKHSLKLCGQLGVGQTPLPEDVNDMFFELQAMLAEWQTDRFLVYQTIDVSFQSNQSMSYTIGPGMQFNTPRPERIEQAFVRQNPGGSPTPVDYPLEMLFSREDYDRIRLKFLTSWPQAIYYDRGYPTGNILVWPIPDSSFTIHLTLMQQLPQLVAPTDTWNLPPLYQRLVEYSLAVIGFAIYKLPPDPVVVAIAKKSMARLRAMNAEIPRLVTGDESGSTNIYDPYNAGSG